MITLGVLVFLFVAFVVFTAAAYVDNSDEPSGWVMAIVVFWPVSLPLIACCAGPFLWWEYIQNKKKEKREEEKERAEAERLRILNEKLDAATKASYRGQT